MHSFYTTIHSCYGDFHQFFRNSRIGYFLAAGWGRQSIFCFLLMLLGLIKVCVFFILLISIYNKQGRAVQSSESDKRRGFSAKRVNSVHLNSFYFKFHFKMYTYISSITSNLFLVAALKACVWKVPKVFCFCSCFVCGTFPFLY